MAATPEKTIDAYISTFPDEAQSVLRELRTVIRQAVPKRATETVRYNMATFRLDGQDLIYFAGWKKHVSLYPVTEEMREALEETSAYKSTGVTIQFPFDKPLPKGLITKIVRYRLANSGSKDGT